MPAARESLLDAARTALVCRPWSAVRMVDVATAAGVSRQTLYNEFGGKDGLGRALVRREIDAVLTGADHALAGYREAGERLPALAEWLVRAARGNSVVRAALTGLWSPRLPAPASAPARVPAQSTAAQRGADGPLPSPGELLALLRDRTVVALSPPRADPADTAELARLTELALRLALSWMQAPAPDGGVGTLVRDTLGAVSATTPTAGARSPR
ncbi:TetR/AcrR family transcriptional regulator [Streptomyces uncialis]|uniref:TetR/AcrR family transcriptional regulator n=1 Tax=Streptomyces uncialis TaxID=1048205 RepID=UPI003818D2BC